MSAIQQLNPVINNLHQSLYGKGRPGFSTPGLAAIKSGTYGTKVAAVFDFLEAAYRKAISIVPDTQRAAESPVFNADRVGNGHSLYTPDRNSYGILMQAFSIVDKREWDAFQYIMDKAFFVLKPTSLLSNLSAVEQTLFLERAGMVPFSPTITASDSTVIAVGLTPGISFLNAWNNLLVPYQQSINEPVYYITSIAGQTPADMYYRKTGQIKAKVYARFPV